MNTTLDLVKGSGAILIGAAAGRMIATKIPIGDTTNPWLNAAKQGLVAILIRKFGARFVGPDLARLASLGAFSGALKDAIISVAPAASSFLGASDSVMVLPAVPGGRIGAYAAYAPSGGGMGVYSPDTGDDVGRMGSYTSDGYPG